MCCNYTYTHTHTAEAKKHVMFLTLTIQDFVFYFNASHTYMNLCFSLVFPLSARLMQIALGMKHNIEGKNPESLILDSELKKRRYLAIQKNSRA